MRKFLFYSWCIGGLIVYGSIVRWAVRSIADEYGLAAMGIAVLCYIGVCCVIARGIDVNARQTIDYRPAPTQARYAASNYLPPPDGSEV